MDDEYQKPIVLAFAGPNGSGKTTVTRRLGLVGAYVNADDIKAKFGLSDLEAAQEAEELRNHLVNNGESFSFETVLSTDRNLLLLQKAKALGYIVKCVYVLTCNPDINVYRVKVRFQSGEGHDVEEGKVRERYRKALDLLPRVIDVCDDIIIFDNSGHTPHIIIHKDTQGLMVSPNEYWTATDIKTICGL